MKSIGHIFVCCLFFIGLQAQPVLHPSIGIPTVPADSDPICTIPVYTGSFAASGLQEGDTAADFTLYSLAGDTFHLASVLASGKHVLLISGSYTCPVFRGKIPLINNLVSTYGTEVAVVVIYTPEAHPTDTSPYFGFINVTSQNVAAGILYPQPVTYGEKKYMVQEMLDSMTLAAPVFIDGPCNEWWLYYGPAPNNATLIDTTGIVFAKHDWLHKFPEDIYCDIDSLLGNTTNCTVSAGGQFNFQMVSQDTVYGPGDGTILQTSSYLVNTHPAENVIVGVKRIQNVLAPGWSTSFCADVCYSTSTDSVTFFIPPLDTVLLHMNFYTASEGDTSFVRIGMRNVYNFSNSFSKYLYGISEETPTQVPALSKSHCVVVPNPSSHFFQFQFPGKGELTVRNMQGQIVHQALVSDYYIWNPSSLPSGIYTYQLDTNVFGKLILIKE